MQVDRTSPYFDNNQRPIISAFATILEKCVFRHFPMLIISRPVVTRNVGSGISAVIGRVTDGFLSVQQTISLWTGSLFGEKIAREGKEGGEAGRDLFTFPSPQFPARPKACSQASRQSARAPLPPPLPIRVWSDSNFLSCLGKAKLVW